MEKRSALTINSLNTSPLVAVFEARPKPDKCPLLSIFTVYWASRPLIEVACVLMLVVFPETVVVNEVSADDVDVIVPYAVVTRVVKLVRAVALFPMSVV